MATTHRAPHFLRSGVLALFEGYESRTLAAALDLSAAPFSLPTVAKLDPGGAHRDVTLEAEAVAKNVYRLLVNGADAAENLVVKNDGGSTIATVNQNEAGIFYCDGTDWVLVAVFTIALS